VCIEYGRSKNHHKLNFISTVTKEAPFVRIICVHGAGESSALWQPVVDQLPMATALDLPGHGGKGGHGENTVEGYAQWLASHIEGDEPVVLAGHSLGGAIALRLALQPQRPSWLAGLALVGSGARLRVSPDILHLLRTDFAAAGDLLYEWAAGDKSVAGLRETFDTAMSQAGPGITEGDYLAADGFDAMDVVREIDLPALAIVGSEDRMTPPKYTRYLRDTMPNCRLVEIEGAGHLVPLERAMQTAQAIGEFAADLSKRSNRLDSDGQVG